MQVSGNIALMLPILSSYKWVSPCLPVSRGLRWKMKVAGEACTLSGNSDHIEISLCHFLKNSIDETYSR